MIEDTCETLNEMLTVTDLTRSNLVTGAGNMFQRNTIEAIDRIEEKINEFLKVKKASCPE